MTEFFRTLQRRPWRKNIPPGVCALMLLTGFAGQFAALVGGVAGMVAAPVAGILLMGAVAGFLVPPWGDWFRMFGFRPVTWPQIKILIRGVIAIFIGNGILTALWQYALKTWAIPFAEEQNIVDLLRSLLARPWEAGWLIFAVVVLIPLFEEIFFRRVFYGLLRPLGGIPALLGCGAIFALVHFFLLGAPALFWMGLMFQYLYLKSRNLWIPVIAHGAVNSVAALLAIFA